MSLIAIPGLPYLTLIRRYEIGAFGNEYRRMPGVAVSVRSTLRMRHRLS